MDGRKPKLAASDGVDSGRFGLTFRPGQPGHDVLRLHRPGIAEPLYVFAVQRSQHRLLRLRLHSFGHGFHPQVVGQGDDGFDDGGVLAVRADPRNERPVDLEGVEGEAVQIAERRVAGAEVVQGQTDPQGAEAP